MEKNKKLLTERATVPKSHPWFQLQQPQVGYIDDFENKKKMFEKGEGFDFATAEQLAFATLLDEGTPVRLSGCLLYTSPSPRDS